MNVTSISHIRHVWQKNGVQYVLKNGSEYVFSYVKNLLLTPYYLWQLRSLPERMSIHEVMRFVETECLGVFKPLQVHSELESLLQYVQKLRPKVLVEIGTANGGTLLAMSKMCHPQAKIISIDLPSGAFGGGYPWYKIPLFHGFVSSNQSLFLLRLDSHSIATKMQLEALLGGRKIDFLLIDGDHTYEGVKQDFEMYSPLVRRGGSIGFHDIVKHQKQMNCHVDKFWSELRKKSRTTIEFVENPRQGFCGIGILQV